MTALMGLDVRLKTARLYLVTDLRSDMREFGNFCEAAFCGGVDILQVRQKGLPKEQELEALDLARTIAQQHQALVCVNDSPALAKEFSADVLHLGQSDDEPRVARPFLHQWALIGRSTHSEEQARAALMDDDVDYFCVGPVFATTTKPDYPPVGLELVEHAAALSRPLDPRSKPWFAIGGINADNLDQVLAAGARRIVVASAITRARDVEAAAGELSGRLRQFWNQDEEMQEYLGQIFDLGKKAEFVPVQGDGNQPESVAEEMAGEPGLEEWGDDHGSTRYHRGGE